MPWKKEFWGKDKDWCRRRLELFETYGLPSVANQTSDNFLWFVFFDYTHTPSFVKSTIKLWQEQRCPSLVPIYVDTFTPDILRKKIIPYIETQDDAVVTTRLDTDDALVPTFIEILQKIIMKNPEFRGFINFDIGYCLNDAKAYIYKDASNMFFSCVVDKNAKFDTAHHFNHAKIEKHGNVLHVRNRPMFLLVNHGQNISKRTNHGSWRVSNSRAECRINLKLNKQIQEEAIHDILLDNIIYALKRPLIPLVRFLRNAKY
jgi:hypothetical protein